jgi:peptidoglycan L-alanyl-D-glutamate endopeptidase CwlK
MNIDEGSLLKLKDIYSELASKWKQVFQDMTKLGYQIKISEGLRNYSDQEIDWKEGRSLEEGKWVITNPKEVITHAPPGKSFHQYGLAIDSCFMGKDPYFERIPFKDSNRIWNQYGMLCKKYGLEWGGDFSHPDRPHCQLTYGLSIDEIEKISDSSQIWKKMDSRKA